MVSFAQFLDNSGIHMQPAAFIAIIAGGLIFIVLLVITVIYVHRRSKRQIVAGAFDKSAFSVVSLTHPRPPLPIYQESPRSSEIDREAQQQDLVGREVRQQEATYMQLVMDLQRPVSRTGSPALPNQTPRRVNWDHMEITPPWSPLTAYPAVAPPLPAPPPAVPDPKPLSAAQLKRGPSVRSLDSASEYSVASAPRDPQERSYQPFNLGLPTIPASPSTPKWPASPGSYVWPKRQRASQIREELAPETYARVRWRMDDESMEPAAAIPVAHALPAMRSVSTPTSPGPALRINVPPPIHYRASFDSTTSASTAHLYYANESTTSSPTLPNITPARTQRPF